MAQTRKVRKRLQKKRMTDKQKNKNKLKTKSLRCRCQMTKGVLCMNPTFGNTLFCKAHQNCHLSPLSGYEPAYDPPRYNDSKVRGTHNCFSYGLNVIDQNKDEPCPSTKKCNSQYHQPGATRKMSKMLYKEENRSCKVVERLMEMDVPMKRTTFRSRCPANTSKIALVVHPKEDYHFIRQDSDGGWSHKDGSNPVKRFDADGQNIVDPFTANRDYRPRSFLNYSDFCGYYCAPRTSNINLSRSMS